MIGIELIKPTGKVEVIASQTQTLEEVYNAGKVDGKTQGYKEGLEQGFDEGLEAGYESGYEGGYSQGEYEGYLNGYEEGYSLGEYEGYLSGYKNGEEIGTSTGIEIGREAEYNAFWDSLQDYGKRRNYWGAFCSWTEATFKPKYPIIATVSKSMFYMSSITEIPEIDLSGATSALDNTFDYAGKLVTIGKIIFAESGTQKINAGFNGCRSLVNVTFEGVIGNSIKLEDCSLLSLESMRSIITALKDYSGTGTTCTLTLHADAKAKLTSADKAIITLKGWTLT